MALHKHVIVILLACLINSCYAYQFYVGGRAGWVPNPSENYNNWAERMRFQVNDTLVFKYKKGSNSVLVVNKDDYDKCNTNNPIMKMDDGNSIFKFDHSGPFFFISGNKNDCQNGSQKLITVVLAIRPPPPPSTPGVSPATSPATSPSVSPATSPVSQTPTSSPATSPAISPATSPATSPSTSPITSPSISPATSPTISPAITPAPASISPSGAIISPSPSGNSSSPSSPSTPGSPVDSPPGGGGNSPPADIPAPTGSKNSAVKAYTTTSAVFVSILFTIIFFISV
ncbi:hypothetical protein EJD97_023850 [Solanum chilense]|uniref:Phytocyanin domain-containing protein n=1 Tax=Solanum chilense TaxID=4083 RepID=A0A6N2ARR0_SOLCI|nr:hypothetical protein EJD97_023850 [Solanum chilense]